MLTIRGLTIIQVACVLTDHNHYALVLILNHTVVINIRITMNYLIVITQRTIHTDQQSPKTTFNTQSHIDQSPLKKEHKSLGGFLK